MSIYHSKNQYHYTYELCIDHQISNESRHRYIGVRSCKVLPEKDDYLGSSKSLNSFLKEHPEVKIIKTILAYFLTREDAGEHEIQLHEEFAVAVNPEFFNLAKHTSTGFCTAGKSHTEETRQKMRKPKSEETKQKMSESKKGRTSPNKGKTLSEETKQKMRKPKSEEHRLKISEKKKGRTHSEETLRKMSESQKGRTQSKEHIRKRSESLRGISISEETRRKMSESKRGRPLPKFVCRISDRKEYRVCDITQHGLEKLGLT